MKTAPPLKEGYSTGTSAAAAAMAAVRLLGGCPLPELERPALPPFILRNNTLVPEFDERLSIPVAQGAYENEKSAWALVIKDGGDDPDATHGAHIIARVSRSAFACLCQPVAVYEAGQPVFLYAGKGVGHATLPGLPVAQGEPAINPEPRKQIAFAACEAAAACKISGPLHIEISVPDGEERARRTLNARLGIVGGISILGTRGIVRPYSHDAWKMAISQGLDVAEALGLDEILLCTGRRSERLGLAWIRVPEQAAIQAADFAAHAIGEAAKHSFSRLNWVCFPGKLLKLAQGLAWTHAKSAAADLRLLASLCRNAGGTEELTRAVAAMPTAAGAFGLMQATADLHKTVLDNLAHMAFDVLRTWLDAAGGQHKKLALHVFSLDGKHLVTLPETHTFYRLDMV